jgi:cytochrome c biogenesis protein CcmG/thiol:disulfide interchange protein DsbE
VAALATAVIVAFVSLTRPSSGVDTPGVAVDAPAPAFAGSTLDGTAFDLASLRGKAVIVNFWGPSCVPCRDEFPLFEAKLAAIGPDHLAIVGILTDDGPDAARAFVASYGATWPTVQDPTGAIKAAYRVLARPQSYFIDGNGVVRKIQVGEVTADDFDRDYALISGS